MKRSTFGWIAAAMVLASAAPSHAVPITMVPDPLVLAASGSSVTLAGADTDDNIFEFLVSIPAVSAPFPVTVLSTWSFAYLGLAVFQTSSSDDSTSVTTTTNPDSTFSTSFSLSPGLNPAFSWTQTVEFPTTPDLMQILTPIIGATTVANFTWEVTAVPEPSGGLLFLVGCAIAAAATRRRSEA